MSVGTGATRGGSRSWVRTSNRWLPARARENQLVAYDAADLRVRWRRSAGEEELPRADVCFLGTPVGWSDQLLVPVLDGSQLLLLALDMRDGATRWRSRLSEEPREGWAGLAVWTPVQLLIAGRDAYVSTGAGWVVAVDADTGAVRWSTQYQRHSIPARSAHAVAVSDDLLFVKAPDSQQLVALDRRHGICRWEVPLGEGEAELNVQGLLLRVTRQRAAGAGRTHGVYQTSTGRLIQRWEESADDRELQNTLNNENWIASFQSTRFAPTEPLAAPAATAPAKATQETRAESPGSANTPAPAAATAAATNSSATPREWRLLVSDAAQDRLLEIDQQGKIVASQLGIPGPGPCCVTADGSRWVVAHGTLALWRFPGGGASQTKSAAATGDPRAHSEQLDNNARPESVSREPGRSATARLTTFPLPARPASLEAIGDRDVLLSFPAARLVAEWNEQRGWGWGTRLSGRPVDAQRLPQGLTRVTLIDDRRVVDVDAAGKIVWESSDIAQPRFARRLPSGRTLILAWGASGILGEWDSEGREIVWSRITTQPPYAAVRLPDQQLALADAGGLSLLSPAGQTVWKIDGLLVTGLTFFGQASR